jgi:hypothetical protein
MKKNQRLERFRALTSSNALLSQGMCAQSMQLVAEVSVHQGPLVYIHAGRQLQLADLPACRGVQQLAVELIHAQGFEPAHAPQGHQAVLCQVQVPLREGLQFLVQHLESETN